MNFAYVEPSGNLVVCLSKSELKRLLIGKMVSDRPRKRPMHFYTDGKLQEQVDTYPIMIRNTPGIVEGQTEHYVQFITIGIEEEPNNDQPN